MEKHRRVKQNVETVLRATKDSTAGRLLAKKMKTVLSQEKRYERAVQSMTQKPLEEEQIQTFSFSSWIKVLEAGNGWMSEEEKS